LKFISKEIGLKHKVKFANFEIYYGVSIVIEAVANVELIKK